MGSIHELLKIFLGRKFWLNFSSILSVENWCWVLKNRGGHSLVTFFCYFLHFYRILKEISFSLNPLPAFTTWGKQGSAKLRQVLFFKNHRNSHPIPYFGLPNGAPNFRTGCGKRAFQTINIISSSGFLQFHKKIHIGQKTYSKKSFKTAGLKIPPSNYALRELRRTRLNLVAILPKGGPCWKLHWAWHKTSSSIKNSAKLIS